MTSKSNEGQTSDNTVTCGDTLVQTDTLWQSSFELYDLNYADSSGLCVPNDHTSGLPPLKMSAASLSPNVCHLSVSTLYDQFSHCFNLFWAAFIDFQVH